MAEKKKRKVSSAKRFGPRYGRTNKNSFAKIEKEQRKKHPCPYCGKEQVRRVSVGIWFCKKCNTKFTGKAYTIGSAHSTKEMVDETAEVAEE